MLMMAEDKRIIVKSYNDMGGKIYDIRYEAEQGAKYKVILCSVRPCVKDIVLDDGCGTGLLLQRLNAHSVGIDLSHKLLSTARFKLKNKPKTHLAQSDADHLPFRPSIFHKVFAVTILQNMPKPEQTLEELTRVSRQHSLIAVSSLKKSFSIGHFKRVLENSGLSIKKLIVNEELKDWIAFATI
jgi:ubiquinone/menaquinone biosynthesis C-methylase UbiE